MKIYLHLTGLPSAPVYFPAFVARLLLNRYPLRSPVFPIVPAPAIGRHSVGEYPVPATYRLRPVLSPYALPDVSIWAPLPKLLLALVFAFLSLAMPQLALAVFFYSGWAMFLSCRILWRHRHFIRVSFYDPSVVSIPASPAANRATMSAPVSSYYVS